MERNSKTKIEDIIKTSCNSYVPSRGFLCGEMPKGKEEPKAPYCLLPRTWRDYVGRGDPSITEVESCTGKNCDLKEALCPICARG